MNVRIGASQLDFYVDVRLRNFDGRWLAMAKIGGVLEVGLGLTGGEALAACLCSLGSDAVAALLADPQLLGVGLGPVENS